MPAVQQVTLRSATQGAINASGSGEWSDVLTGSMLIVGLGLTSGSSFSGQFELRWRDRSDDAVGYPLPVTLQQTAGAGTTPAPAANTKFVHGAAVVTANGYHTAIIPHFPGRQVRLEWTVSAGSIVAQCDGNTK